MTRAHHHFAIIGHRGSPRREKENTLASIERALAEGADGFETDVRRLSDGSMVLFHDHEIAGRAVETFTLAELERVHAPLTKLEALSGHAGTSAMTLEIKRSGFEKELAAVVHGWDSVTISSFDHRVLERMRDAGFAGKLGVVFSGRLHALADYCRRLDATVVYPEFHHVDRPIIQECTSSGIAVIPWTVNAPADWARMLREGCHGIITDFPAEAVLWRRSSG